MLGLMDEAGRVNSPVSLLGTYRRFMDLTNAISALSDPEKVVIILAGIFFFQQYWKDRSYKQRVSDEALNRLVLSVNSLEVKVENLNKYLDILPRLKADIDAAHDKIREYGKGSNGA